VQDGWTALHQASYYGRGEVVKVLVEAKANVDVQTEVRRGWGQRCRERVCVYV
jgi:ankyrin repeat protein